jgi:hypothetical protein
MHNHDQIGSGGKRVCVRLEPVRGRLLIGIKDNSKANGKMHAGV